MLFTLVFWVQAAERAVKTAAQSALLTIGAEQLDAFSADYHVILGMAAGGALLSVLTSVASIKIGEDKGSPSVV